MKFYFAVILMCTIAVSSFLFSIIRYRKIIRTQKQEFEAFYNKMTDKVIAHVKYSSGYRLSDSIYLIDKKGTKISPATSSLFTSPVLILKMAAENCSYCKESALSGLSQLRKQLPNNIPIVVFLSGSHYSSNSLSILEKRYSNQFIFFHLPKEFFLPADDLNLPYFFKLKNRIISNLFIPDTEIPRLTESYSSFIEKYLR